MALPRQLIECELTLRHDDPLMRDHRVHGVRVMPGVTFLDIVMRLVAARGGEPERHALRDVLFIEPAVVTEEFDRRIRITLTPQGDGVWRVAGRARRLRGETPEGGWRTNFEAILEERGAAEAAPVRRDLAALRAGAGREVDVDAAYAISRRIDIHHFEFMKGLGRAWVGADFVVADLHLGALAAEYLDHFRAHPAYLDAATVVFLLAQHQDETKARPFIPLTIERFTSIGPLPERCTVVIDRRRARVDSDDLVWGDLELYDAEGLLLARLEKIRYKHIRSHELITRLARGEEPEAAETVAKVAAKVAEKVAEKVARVVPDALGTGAAETVGMGAAETGAAGPRQRVGDNAFHLGADGDNAFHLLAPETTGEALRALVAGALGRAPADVAPEAGFYDQGLDSTHLLKLVRELETRLGERLYPTLLFEYSSVAALAEYLEERFGNRLVKAVAPKPVAVAMANPASAAPPEAEASDLLCLEAEWRAAPPEADAGDLRVTADLVFVDQRDAAGPWRELWPDAVAVVAGDHFGWRDGRTVMLRRAHAEDAARLFDELAGRGRAAGRALFLWAWRAPSGIDEAVEAGLGSLLVLAQAALKRRQALDWVVGHAAHPLLEAVSGFARTLWRENPRLVLRAVERGADWALDAHACARLAAEWARRGEWDAQVRWMAAGREVRGWRDAATGATGAADVAGLPLRPDGVYLITGGAGGLARIFAAALREREPAARIVLAGRSALPPEKASGLARLGAEYRVCDVADEAAVARLVAELRGTLGPIRGVLHTAGVLRDAQVPGKTPGQVAEVLRPKVRGTLALDRALADEPLDFFVLFSSTAAAMGSAGQSDYSFANAFLDAWAEEREALRRAGARRGRTLSVNWPLWAEGGMTVDAATRADLAAHLGMVPLRTADGVAALARGLASPTAAAGWLVAAGDATKLRAALRFSLTASGPGPTATAPSTASGLAPRAPASVAEAGGEGDDAPPADAVAIIGVAGRYPGARTPAELWARLRAGEDLIREIPPERWDHAAIYDPDRTKKGRANSKWGGFLEDFDHFEPRFFNLSPREAELLDPQERLFLQTAWQTFENAGYNPAGKALRETGVFVGVMWNQYQLFGAEELLRGHAVAPNFSTASIANRVSYALNLSGPSLALDTMCSSSLTAIHLACESLRRGECRTALAGGVSLSLHPAKYLFLGENQMASSDGRCRSFGAGGDGYGPGEGVGAVLLKPLARALADGDVIHGVIRATAVNHGGRASGFTVPAPRAQATVVEAALARAGVDAGRVGYIEAHGTGTSLGDPIEIAGLEAAFRGAGRPAGSCAIGSVKSNFGHLEAAAGVVGLTKVLLQFEHGRLAPSLHAEELNPHIDFARSPFRVQRELAEWARPADGGPRVAGVSSFGAGGSNAHLIVEEWIERRRPGSGEGAAAGDGAEWIPVSADTPAALRELATELAEALERLAAKSAKSAKSADAAEGGAATLCDVAFTLQTGRDGRALRRAFVATNLAEAARGLRRIAAGETPGSTPTPQVTPALAPVTPPAASVADWLAGRNIDWTARWSERGERRVALPAYPFRGERYWIPLAPNGVGRRPRLHPLLDGWSGAASLEAGEVVFTKRLSLAEPVLAQHRVRGRAVLPGVAHVEMAYAALAELAAPEGYALTKLFWLAPVFVDEAGRAVRVVLRKVEQGIGFALEADAGEAKVFSRGVFVRREDRAEERLDLAKLADGGRELAGEGYYERHAETGVGYGPMYRLVKSLRRRGDEALAEVELGGEWTRELGRYRMHPGLFDAALHATADLMDGFGASGAPLLPFAAGEVEWRRPLPARLRAYAVKAGFNLCHVALLDEDGRVCAKVKNLAARELAEPAAAAGRLATLETGVDPLVAGPAAAPDGLDGKSWFYRPRWVPVARADEGMAAAAEVDARTGGGRVVVLALDAPEGAAEALRAAASAAGGSARLLRGARAAAETLDADDLLAGADELVCLIGREGPAPSTAEEGVLLGLAHRLARAVAAGGRTLTLRLLTDALLWGDEAERLPAGASLHGFLRTAAKEIAGLRVACVDLPLAGLAAEPGLAGAVLAEAASSRPREVVYRAGMRFERRLEPLRLSAPAASPYRTGGVYWIVGGLGHIGRTLALRLAKTARARIALTGRRAPDATVAERLRELEAAGAEALYVRADAGDAEAMDRARAEIEARFGAIRGVFLSAVHLVSRNVVNLAESELRASVAPKIQATAWAVERWAGGGLDFLAVFSSASTFEVNLGQAAYAAGGTFQDALVARAAERAPFPVRLINWGYWESIDSFVENMGERLASAGVRPLRAADGMAALERVLAGPAGQVLALDVDEELARRLGADFSRSGEAARPGPSVSLAVAVAEAARAAGDGARAGEARPDETARAALENYSRSRLVGLMRELERAGGEAAVAPAYRAWWAAAREALRAPATGAASGEPITRGALLARHPELEAKVALLDACAAGTVEVVTGRRGALELLFPKGSKALVEAVYAGDAEAEFYNAQLRRLVCAQVAERLVTTTGPVRILEVGAGTGGTSRRLLAELAALAERFAHGGRNGAMIEWSGERTRPGCCLGRPAQGSGPEGDGGTPSPARETRALPGPSDPGPGEGSGFAAEAAGRIQYFYTDVSPTFVRNGEAEFGARYPFARFVVLDGEREPEAQGLAAGSFDLVLGTNVFHALRDLRAGLERARRLLRSGGVLVLNEITRPQLWATMTFGLTAGWWHFEDPAARLPHGPVTSAERWAWLLRAAGFATTAVVNAAGAAEVRVIAGVADGVHPRAVAAPAAPAPAPSASAVRIVSGTGGTGGSPATGAATDRGGDAVGGGTVEDYVRGVFAAALKLRAADLDARATYDVYGIDSLVVMDITRRLEADFGELPATLLFQHGTIEKLSAHLAARHGAACARVTARSAAVSAPASVFGAVAGAQAAAAHVAADHAAEPAGREREDDIAIIGVGCRFPDADTLDELWANLAAGRCSVTERPADAWRMGPGAPGAFLRDVDKFDAGYFRITPAEAERLDPQARLFLETAAAALEDAACGAARLDAAGRAVGVFVGVMNSDYPLLDPVRPEASQGVVTGYSAIANRVSFHLDLHGPSLALDTACSSSLTALHLACQSLRQGECRMALAGGVNLVLHAKHVAALAGMGMLSPSGRCRAFGAGADGMVEGEGVGVVVLKPLAAARRDGDPIRAVIKGSFVNAGGRTAGFTVPNPGAQARVVAEALRRAGVPPETVTYLEAHGTGTALGDPIEIAGLAEAHADRPSGARCALGSVKSNLGHLESAAGVAGLCKVIAQFRAGRIAPSLFAETLNPKLGLERTPFFVAREGMAWERGRDARGRTVPRRAGVSSFGAGGANAHVVLEEWIEDGQARARAADAPRRIVLSAKTPEALRGRARRLRAFLAAHPETALADVARTLREGRDPMPVKWSARVGGLPELERRLAALEAGRDAGDAVGANAGAGSGVDSGADAGESESGGRLIALPTYPFARDRHWLAGGAGPEVAAETATLAAERAVVTQANGGKTTTLSFERAEWIEVAAPTSPARTAGPGRRVLVLAADGPCAWAEACRARGDRVWVVRAGRVFRRLAESDFELPPGEEAGAAALAETLAAEGACPDLVINAWTDKDFVPNGAAVAVQLAKGPLAWTTLLGALRRERTGSVGHLDCVQVVAGGRSNPLWRAAAGFGRSLMREDGRIRFRVLGGAEARAALLDAEVAGEVVFAEAGRVWELRRSVGASPAATGEGWRERGVYLITGGAGGLGRKVARMLARERRARLVLAGRSPADGATEAVLAELRALGGEAVYVAADVATEAGARRAVAEAKTRFGVLHGVMHAAGVLRDGFLLRKRAEDARAVLAPKVAGAVWLDVATRDEAPELFVLFSSFVAAAGNAGQTDYAYANGFLDGFAGWRAERVRAGGRRGATVSIGWGPWRDGGMRPAGAEDAAMMPDHPELRALSDEAGLAVLRAAAGAGETHFTAEARASRASGAGEDAPGESVAAAERSSGPDAVAVERLLARVMAEVTKIPVERLAAGTPFEDCGIDSIVVMKFNRRLAALAGGEAPRTLLYEARNLRDLSVYLCREYAGLMARALGAAGGASAATAEPPRASAKAASVAPAPVVVGAVSAASAEAPERAGNAGVAVVGLAARLPGARDADEFWANLIAGRDSVRAVAGTRWPADPEGRIYCPAGGMLEGVDEFDPQFFNLSPREARSIDPQERLFLQTAWHALEDAGYSRRRLRELGGEAGLGAPVGVWVGVTTNDYQLLGGGGGVGGGPGGGGAPQSLPWSIANRLSYFLDLAGPSLPVDTACSSSLTALHLACESLARGECRMAVVGGVNLYLHPAKLVTACEMKMLSRTGRCRSFGDGADGYAPGEGVGAVVLKPLADALRDGDRIHGVIRGTAVNHGGRTHGYTVPNPRAQTALVRAALGRAGVDARTVSYVEAHGTGTALGDPIEVRALTQALGPRATGGNPCALGSVKSNIGHLEAAAGIAGLIKVLLQLRHRSLAPSLHAETVNPAIDFAATPFRLQRERAVWTRPVVDGVEAPRRAGLSSFGAGGANAHAVIEEAPEPVAANAGASVGSDADPSADAGRERSEVWVFSARTEEALRETLRAWRDFLRTESGRAAAPADLAHTLRAGREAWEERLAFVARDRAELTAQLDALAAGEGGEAPLPVWRGRVTSDGAASRLLEDDEDARAMIAQWLRKGKLARLAELWAAGVGVDWAALPTAGAGRRRIVSAPGYPFARLRCWVDAPAAKPVAAGEVITARAASPERTERTVNVASGVTATATADVVAEDFCYRPVWRPAPRADGGETPVGGGPVLIVRPDGAEPVETFVEALRSAHTRDEVRVAEAGARTDWAAALEGFVAGGTIYFLGGLHAPAATAEEAAERLGDLARLEATQEAGVYSLFRLLRVAAERGLLLEATTLKIVTAGVYPVWPGERTEPFGAPLIGLAKSLAKEYPRLRVVVADLAPEAVFGPAAAWAGAVTTAVVDEAAARGAAEFLRAEAGRPGGGEVAWRAGRRYERLLEPVEPGTERAEVFVEGGVYVIVGGASGIGLELSRELARAHRARVAWIGRRAEDAEIARRRAEIAELGGEALYLRADVTDAPAMERAAAEIAARLGVVRGVVHSALVIEENILERMSEATLRRGLAAKVAGTAVLWRVFGGGRLDFLLLHSSAQAFIGNPGQGNYTAACHFLDAFAWAADALGRFPVRTINWGWWSEVGHGAKPEYRERFPARGLRSIAADEGVAALRRVLRGGAVQVLALKARADFLAGLGVDSGLRALRLGAGAEGGAGSVRLAEVAARLTVPAPEPAEIARLTEAFAAFEQLGFTLLLDAFRRMGACREAGERWTLAALEQRLGLRGGYARLLRALVNVLRKAGLAEGDADGEFFITAKAGEAEFARPLDPVAAAERLAEAHPALAGHARLLGLVLASYPEILRGEKAAVEVMFPRSSTVLMERIYTGNVVAAYYSSLVARAVVARVEAARARLAPGERVTIIEAGAGTGGTSAAVLEALRPHAEAVRYLYTDVSPAFAKHFEAKFAGRYPFAEFRVLDASRDVTTQGFALGEADVVLAANALHATPRMRVTLGEVKRLLRRGGWLVLDEVNEVQDFATLAFGLLDGWWLFADAENRLPDSPLIGSRTWEALLAEAGFAPVLHTADPRLAGTGLGHDILVAESDGWVWRANAASAAGEVARGGAATGSAGILPAFHSTSRPEAGAPGDEAGTSTPLPVAAGVEAELREVLQLGEAPLDRDRPFTDLGVDSILAIDIANRLNLRFAVRLRPTDLYSHATVRRLAAHIRASGGKVGAVTREAVGGDGAAAAPVPAAKAAEAPLGVGNGARTRGGNGNGRGHVAPAAGKDAMMDLLRELQAGRRTVDEVDRAWVNN